MGILTSWDISIYNTLEIISPTKEAPGLIKRTQVGNAAPGEQQQPVEELEGARCGLMQHAQHGAPGRSQCAQGCHHRCRAPTVQSRRGLVAKENLRVVDQLEG